MIRAVTCYTITCDICATEYDTDGAEERSLHFESEADALANVLADGWTADAGRLICRTCVHGRNRARCATTGHIWDHWIPCHCRGLIADHALFGCDLYRLCLRPGCDAHDTSTLAALPTTDDSPGR
ncbi:hypothetical protein [Pseudonocardia sp. NPDC046786]|uniref:hypothetical protein n=1 Tax=Pseudonocardia sp. NPDC046786 TaxID=3155471 RepID=UPI0033C12286